jgi:hypothetical protein
LELTMKSTAPTPSNSLALVSLRDPQYLMFHLCLPSLGVFSVSARGSTTPSYSSRVLLCHCCTRIWSGREALTYCLHSLQFLQGMLGNACCHQEEIHYSNPTAGVPLHRYTLEFGTITNLQHLKSRRFFLPQRHWALCQRITLQELTNYM